MTKKLDPQEKLRRKYQRTFINAYKKLPTDFSNFFEDTKSPPPHCESQIALEKRNQLPDITFCPFCSKAITITKGGTP